MIRGRAEKRTDPDVVEADRKFRADEIQYKALVQESMTFRQAVYLRDVVARIQREEA